MKYLQSRNISVFDKLKEMLNTDDRETSFKLFHININSFCNDKNMNNFVTTLHQIGDLDCIVLSETWQMTNSDIYRGYFLNYDIVYNYGDINRNDEVIVCVKKSLN